MSRPYACTDVPYQPLIEQLELPNGLGHLRGPFFVGSQHWQELHYTKLSLQSLMRLYRLPDSDNHNPGVGAVVWILDYSIHVDGQSHNIYHYLAYRIINHSEGRPVVQHTFSRLYKHANTLLAGDAERHDAAVNLLAECMPRIGLGVAHYSLPLIVVSMPSKAECWTDSHGRRNLPPIRCRSRASMV
jgi:hypothetical protein